MKKLIDKIFNDGGYSWKSYLIRGVICIAIAVCAAFFIELLMNRHLLTLDDGSKGLIQVDMVKEDDGVYQLEFDRRYVDKLRFSYEAAGAVEADIKVNVSEPGAEDNFTVIHDANNQYIRESISKIDMVTNKIRIEITDGEDVEITAGYIDNRFELNYRRMIAVMSAVISIMFILCFSTIMKERLEVAFVVIALGMGISYINIMPTQKIAWDECAHFKGAYTTTLQSEVGVSDIISVYCDDAQVWPLNQPQTIEEYEELDAYLDEYAIYDKSADGVSTVENSAVKISNIGYVVPGLGLTVGRILKLPFSDMFRLGKYFNLLMYIAVVYFAIRRCSMGKRILTIIALMPTLVITACVYSRDATLNAFALLGMSYILSVFAEDEKKISWKDYIVFLVSLYIVSAVKAIYAPFLLIILLLPKDKFKDKKTMYIMKAGVFVIGLLLMLSFIVPATSSTNTIGDSRGGDTSGTRQMDFIFSYPIIYTKILLTAIRMNAINYTMGASALGEVGHWGLVPYTNVLLLIMFFVALTDKNDRKLKVIPKLGIVALSFVIVCFVWTSMYLSFTEVGSMSIAGVQGRYYIPVIFPLMLVLNTDKISVKYNQRWYNTALMGAMIILQYLSMYDLVLRNYCS